MNNKNNVYVVSACRTAIGSLNGQFRHVPATLLGTIAIKFCLNRIHLSPQEISEVIMGQVLTAGCGPNPAHVSATQAGIPSEVPAITVNMLSGSGLKAVYMAYQVIRSGDAKFVVCGGQENMTRSQHVAYLREDISEVFKAEDTLETDGLTDAFLGLQMPQILEYLAGTYEVSRTAQDKFAFKSHTKTLKAVEEHYFIHEIAPVIHIEKDEIAKSSITEEKLFQMKTLFEDNLEKLSSITAGNSSTSGDGAAALILCNEKEVVNHDFVPFAKIVAFAQTGLEPIDVGLAAIDAIQKVLVLADWTKEDVDLFEINETSAVEALVVVAALELDFSKVNVSGGAIALGDPLGASGARILVTLIYNLVRLKLNKGVAALCIGGGMGIAVAVEKPAEHLII